MRLSEICNSMSHIFCLLDNDLTRNGSVTIRVRTISSEIRDNKLCCNGEITISNDKDYISVPTQIVDGEYLMCDDDILFLIALYNRFYGYRAIVKGDIVSVTPTTHSLFVTRYLYHNSKKLHVIERDGSCTNMCLFVNGNIDRLHLLTCIHPTGIRFCPDFHMHLPEIAQ